MCHKSPNCAGWGPFQLCLCQLRRHFASTGDSQPPITFYWTPRPLLARVNRYFFTTIQFLNARSRRAKEKQTPKRSCRKYGAYTSAAPASAAMGCWFLMDSLGNASKNVPPSLDKQRSTPRCQMDEDSNPCSRAAGRRSRGKGRESIPRDGSSADTAKTRKTYHSGARGSPGSGRANTAQSGLVKGC